MMSDGEVTNSVCYVTSKKSIRRKSLDDEYYLTLRVPFPMIKHSCSQPVKRIEMYKSSNYVNFTVVVRCILFQVCFTIYSHMRCI